MQKKIIIGLALILGIGMTLFSYTMISEQVETATKTVEIVVLKTDVEAYSIIDAKNITTKAVSPNIADEKTVTKQENVIGKATAAPLYAGKPIDIRNIIDAKEDIQEKQVVGVYIDAARCAGVTEGDIVDIYRVTESAGNPSPCIASNSRVLKVTNESGVSVKQLSNGDAKTYGAPKIIYLLVKPAEVSFVIQGSVEQKNTYLSLAKKSKESTPVHITEVVDE